jgi:hypothetical protein
MHKGNLYDGEQQQQQHWHTAEEEKRLWIEESFSFLYSKIPSILVA